MSPVCRYGHGCSSVLVKPEKGDDMVLLEHGHLHLMCLSTQMVLVLVQEDLAEQLQYL